MRLFNYCTLEAVNPESEPPRDFRLKIPYEMYTLAGFTRRQDAHFWLIKNPSSRLKRYVADAFTLIVASFPLKAYKFYAYLERNLEAEPRALANALENLASLDVNIAECRSIDLGGDHGGRLELLCSGHSEQLLQELHNENPDPPPTATDVADVPVYSEKLRLHWYREKIANSKKLLDEAILYTNHPCSEIFHVNSGEPVTLLVPQPIRTALAGEDALNYVSLEFESATNTIKCVSRNTLEMLIEFAVDMPNEMGQLLRILAPLGKKNLDLRIVLPVRDYSLGEIEWATYLISANIRDSKFSLFTSDSLERLLNAEISVEKARNAPADLRSARRWKLQVKRSGNPELRRDLRLEYCSGVVLHGDMALPSAKGKVPERIVLRGTSTKGRTIDRFTAPDEGTQPTSTGTTHAQTSPQGAPEERGIVHVYRFLQKISKQRVLSVELAVEILGNLWKSDDIKIIAEKAWDETYELLKPTDTSNLQRAELAADLFLVTFSDHLYGWFLANRLKELECTYDVIKNDIFSEERAEWVSQCSEGSLLKRDSWDEWLGELYRDIRLGLGRQVRMQGRLWVMRENGVGELIALQPEMKMEEGLERQSWDKYCEALEAFLDDLDNFWNQLFQENANRQTDNQSPTQTSREVPLAGRGASRGGVTEPASLEAPGVSKTDNEAKDPFLNLEYMKGLEERREILRRSWSRCKEMFQIPGFAERWRHEEPLDEDDNDQ